MSDRKSWDKAGKVCSSCAEMQYQDCDHVRGGKTQREHADGTWGARFANRGQRISWQKTGGDNKTFPIGTCNGKKNRSRAA